MASAAPPSSLVVPWHTRFYWSNTKPSLSPDPKIFHSFEAENTLSLVNTLKLSDTMIFFWIMKVNESTW